MKQDRDILRKAAQYFARDDPVTRCWFVDDHRADYPVKRLCELVELRRATFYRWANPPPSQRVVDDARLANEIVEVHQAWVYRAL